MVRGVTFRPDPKPERRHKATQSEWEHLRALKLTGCRLCGAVNATLHHIVPRSLGGDDVADNLCSLCGSGTTGCHGLVEARDPYVLSAIRAALTPDELAYCIGKVGAGRFDRMYPTMEERREAA